MGSYTQSPGRKHNGKEYKKRKQMCVQLSHFALKQKLIQYYTSIGKKKQKTNFSPFCCQLSIVPSDVGQEEDLAKGD